MAYSKHDEVRAAVLADLEANPKGLYVEPWAKRFGLKSCDISRVIAKMRNSHPIMSVKEGAHGRATRARYYLKHHEAAAMAEHEATRGKTWGLGRASEKVIRQRKKEREEAAKRWNNGDLPVNLPEPIKGPSCHDMRHTVHTPEPCFSAMKPGNYLPADSWAARVYGGGR